MTSLQSTESTILSIIPKSRKVIRRINNKSSFRKFIVDNHLKRMYSILSYIADALLYGCCVNLNSVSEPPIDFNSPRQPPINFNSPRPFLVNMCNTISVNPLTSQVNKLIFNLGGTQENNNIQTLNWINCYIPEVEGWQAGFLKENYKLTKFNYALFIPINQDHFQLYLFMEVEERTHHNRNYSSILLLESQLLRHNEFQNYLNQHGNNLDKKDLKIIQSYLLFKELSRAEQMNLNEDEWEKYRNYNPKRGYGGWMMLKPNLNTNPGIICDSILGITQVNPYTLLFTFEQGIYEIWRLGFVKRPKSKLRDIKFSIIDKILWLKSIVALGSKIDSTIRITFLSSETTLVVREYHFKEDQVVERNQEVHSNG